MEHIWIIAAAIVLLMVFARLRSRRSAVRLPDRTTGPRVQGSRIRTVLHPRAPTACLFDHGVQFGRGFRRKEGPRLPHGAECLCETESFSFTSTEVFNGALRGEPGVRTTVAGLPPEQGADLLERLKTVDGGALPATVAEYLEKVGLSRFSAACRHDMELFLKERYAFLSQEVHPRLNDSHSPSG